MREVRITVAVATLLRVFLDEPDKAQYGYGLMRQTGYPSGKLYPILARLESAGWLIKEREQIDPARAGRPARRTYRLTGDGAQQARLELAELQTQLSGRSNAGVSGRSATAGGMA